MSNNEDHKKYIRVMNDIEPKQLKESVRKSGRYPWNKTTDQNENKEKKDEEA